MSFKEKVYGGRTTDHATVCNCLVANPIRKIIATIFNFLFNCMTVGQASDSMMALAYSFYWLFGAYCLSLAGPTVAHLKVFFSSYYRYP